MHKHLSYRTVKNEEPEQRMQEVKEVAVCLIGFRKGCRCNDCKKASTAYSKQSKEKARQRFKADPSSLKKHGYYGYQIGCRCDVCKLTTAQMVSNREQKKIENFERTGIFPNEAIKHGMEIGYRNGCRCKECKKALYNKAIQRFKADPSRLKKHGHYGYQIGCRCDVCKNAAKLQKSIAYQKNKEHFKKTGTFLSKKTKHGSVVAFKLGCRCIDCKKIGTKISDEIKAKAIKKFKADPSSLKKHGEYGYQIGCRCDVCNTGRILQDSKRNQKQKEHFERTGAFINKSTTIGTVDTLEKTATRIEQTLVQN